MSDYAAQADKAKARALKGVKRYYYVYFIATHEQYRGQGTYNESLRNLPNLAFLDR